MSTQSRVEQRKQSRLIQDLPQGIVVYALLALVVVIMLGPYLYILSASFKETYILISVPPQIIPAQPTLANYIYIITELPFVQWFVNSVFVGVAVTLGTVFIDALT